ncbi:MAG TPA: hypothetical protein VKF80_00810 [Candidatus Eisenbacteria bacterium]|nr:hypothetical protein [Candidatus Eisenbacteria bacterium]
MIATPFPDRRRLPFAPTPWLALAIVALGLASAGCESARRPVPKNPIARDQARREGRALVERACDAAGGLERWRAIKDVSFRLDDHWRGVAARVVRPWPVENVSGPFEALLALPYGRVRITDKNGSVTYGLGASGPWAMRGKLPSSEPGDLATARSTVPVFLFDFEMPFAFLSDDAVQHSMGIRPAPPGGPVYEVLVTYPWYTGDRSHDWYVARFDTSTMRLRSVTFTASLWGPGMIEYTDDLSGYQEIDSLWIPTRHDVRMSYPFRPEMHDWSVSSVQFNAGLEDTTFRGPGHLLGGS